MTIVPERNCPLCPRLADFRDQWREQEPDWHNAPVPGFGEHGARFLVVGLAPGLRGANRTGRPFTGDGAGALLYPALLESGFAHGMYGARTDDGLVLVDCRITNAVRCVPPANRPDAKEIRTCNKFLVAEIGSMPRLRAILALGGIAHTAVIDACASRRSAFPFGHGARHQLSCGITVFDSYHCSRLNTNTGRLTRSMFMDVLMSVRDMINASGDAGSQ